MEMLLLLLWLLMMKAAMIGFETITVIIIIAVVVVGIVVAVVRVVVDDELVVKRSKWVLDGRAKVAIVEIVVECRSTAAAIATAVVDVDAVGDVSVAQLTSLYVSRRPLQVALIRKLLLLSTTIGEIDYTVAVGRYDATPVCC